MTVECQEGVHETAGTVYTRLRQDQATSFICYSSADKTDRQLSSSAFTTEVWVEFAGTYNKKDKRPHVRYERIQHVQNTTEMRSIHGPISRALSLVAS